MYFWYFLVLSVEVTSCGLLRTTLGFLVSCQHMAKNWGLYLWQRQGREWWECMFADENWWSCSTQQPIHGQSMVCDIVFWCFLRLLSLWYPQLNLGQWTPACDLEWFRLLYMYSWFLQVGDALLKGLLHYQWVLMLSMQVFGFQIWKHSGWCI